MIKKASVNIEYRPSKILFERNVVGSSETQLYTNLQASGKLLYFYPAMNNQFSEEKEKIRLETFIDAILAIIITILVLEFKVPDNAYTSDGEIKSYIWHMMPSLFSYFISFVTIVVLWMDHHNLFRNLKRADTKFVLLNFLFILFLSATPFTTALAGRNHESSFAVAVLGVNYSLMNLSFMFIWAYASITKIFPATQISAKYLRRDVIISIIGMLLMLLSIPLAYVNTDISFALFIIVILLHLIKHLLH